MTDKMTMGEANQQIVDKQLSSHEFVIIPTHQVGLLRPEYDAKGNVRPNAIGFTITDISEIVYADSISIHLGGNNDR